MWRAWRAPFQRGPPAWWMRPSYTTSRRAPLRCECQRVQRRRACTASIQLAALTQMRHRVAAAHRGGQWTGLQGGRHCVPPTCAVARRHAQPGGLPATHRAHASGTPRSKHRAGWVAVVSHLFLCRRRSGRTCIITAFPSPTTRHTAALPTPLRSLALVAAAPRGRMQRRETTRRDSRPDRARVLRTATPAPREVIWMQ